MTILILGATGLVGSKCVEHALADSRIDRVIAVTRRPMDTTHPKLTNLIVDYDRLEDYASEMRADAVLTALGTTLAQAGNPAKFRVVDYDYQLRAAQIAKKNGTKTFVLLSSGGADAKSLLLYTKVKGQIEDAIAQLGFERLAILRPSLLLGERQGYRPAEAMATWVSDKLSFVFKGALKRFKPIEGDIVAQAMVHAVQKPYTGVRLVENLEIFTWAKS
ncbi:MAG: NAD-dependent epimerase/dehydratase family protein [Bacteroidetes bacterium]|nr:NAD-dependent epimerase/dehydratase family protein [Bacteroidota bacterium]